MYIELRIFLLFCYLSRRRYNVSDKLKEESIKRSLKRYRNNLACVARLERKLRDLNDRITDIKSPNFSGMPRGGVPVTIDDLMSDKIDLEKRIGKLKAKSRFLKQSVYDEIDTLEDSRCCEILEAHFIDGLSIETIADKMGYTERRVYALYKKGISLLSVYVQ